MSNFPNSGQQCKFQKACTKSAHHFNTMNFFLNMMSGVTFSKYFEWEDGIQCQKLNLTKFSPVRFLKFGQIQFLTLDSVSPVKILGKIHPRSTTFKLAQKSCRKQPAAQISKSLHKELAPF